jgi:eukaryotic-like serine/threonine-protein kinase
MSSVLPSRIGHYVPLRKLGQGGMGIVYCARDERDESRLVALKVISQTATGAKDETGKRFQREARILEGLRHPNIVSFYEVGVQGTQGYFAMELLSGSTLSPYCGRPWYEVLPLFVQVCAGMRYLAARRIVHRDLSLDNIFIVNQDGQRIAKILDFGIAKDTAREETLHNFTRTGLLMGKPMYWSPEQIGTLGPGEKIDFRSDVYTLGVIFYRVLSGKLPFHSDSPIGYINLHLTEPPEPLVAAPGAPELPASLTALIHKMLEKDREERPQSYKEIVEVFHSLLGQELTDVEQWSQELLYTTDAPTGGGTAPTPISGYSEKQTSPFTPEPRTSPLTPAPETAKMMVVPIGATSATTPMERPAAAPPARRTKLFVALAAAAVVLVAAGIGISRLREREKEEGTPKPPALTSGTLALSTLPWARVVSITDSAANRKVPLAAELTTPTLIELPASRYRVELASGLGPETATFEIEVAPGRTVAKTLSLVPADRAVKLLE